MAIFGPKPWVNPFWKMSMLRLFDVPVFIAQKGDFPFYNIVKDIFLVLVALKKLDKWPFLDQTIGNHGLDQTLWKNVNFSTFWSFCFYSLEIRFFVVEYRKSHFPCLYCLKKKSWKNGHFFDQNYGFTPLEKSQFFDFWTSCFYSLEKRFFVLENR